MNDWELLQEWSGQRSEDAFAQLVRRHLEFVHASARRQVTDAALAEDVTQAVFLLLARKAGSLGRDVILPSWLFRTTRFVASRALRAERRRRGNEQEAATMNPSTPPESARPDDERWAELQPHLDAAVASLPAADRDAILMRFFQRRSLRDVGAGLGISEEAAKKRVHRALEKLRGSLAIRGSIAPGTGLAALLTVAPVTPVSGTLAGSIIATATGGTPASAAASMLTQGASRDWAWVRWRGWLPWMAAALLTIGVSGRWWGPITRTPERPPAAASSPVPIAAGQPDSTTTQAVPIGPVIPAIRTLLLTVMSDEDGRPLADARVEAMTGDRRQGFTEVVEVTSDHPGIFSMAVPASEFFQLRVWVDAPGRVPRCAIWRSYEFNQPVLLHTTRLERGLPLAGEVLNEAGAPVPGARILFTAMHSHSLSREVIAFNRRLSSIDTDAQGRFRADQMPRVFPDHGIRVSVVHPEYAVERFAILNRTQLGEPKRVILTPGISLRGRLLSDQGEPVTGAILMADLESPGPECSATPDADGRFLFPHLKPGSVVVHVEAPGYRELERTVSTDGSGGDLNLRLTPLPRQETAPPVPRVLLSGEVLDAESGDPIPEFRILVQGIYGGIRLLGDGLAGEFTWELERPDLLDIKQLVIEAPGYRPESREFRPSEPPPDPFTIRLQRDVGISGWVYTPDGAPAVGVEISLAGDAFRLRLNQPTHGPRQSINAGHPVNRAITDARGHFRIAPQHGARWVVMVHARGCRVIPVEAATNGPVTLDAWGQIEGTVFASGQPLPKARVNVGFQSPAYGVDDLRIGFDFNTVADDRGRFQFTHVPPGQHWVQRVAAPRGELSGPTGMSHGEAVTVVPGETSTVVLGGRGRPVVGRLVLSRPLPGYDWNMDLPVLVQERPDLKEPPFPGHPQSVDSRTHVQQSLALDTYQLAHRKSYLSVEPDGTFRADSVQPGTYSLQVMVRSFPAAPPAEEWEWNRPLLGGRFYPVVVPDDNSSDALDLGRIVVPLTAP